MDIKTEELAEAIVQRMKDDRHAIWIDPETHANQHRFIEELISERKERQARHRRIEEKIAGSLILSVVLVVIGFIGAGAMAWLRSKI